MQVIKSADSFRLCDEVTLQPGQGSRDKASAVAFSLEYSNSTEYGYDDRVRAYLCKRAAAVVGTLCFGPTIVSRGLWSVTSITGLPYKNW